MANIEDEKLKGLMELLKQGGLTTILGFLIFYFGSIYVAKLEGIEKDILQIKIELVKMQTQSLDRQKIQHIIQEKIKIYHQQNK